MIVYNGMSHNQVIVLKKNCIYSDLIFCSELKYDNIHKSKIKFSNN